MLIIKLDSEGNPTGHPYIGDNIARNFGIDLDNLPSDWAVFERVEEPETWPYLIHTTTTYEKGEDGIVRDVHHTIEMTDEQKLELQNQVENQWTSNGGWSSWTLNTTTCRMEPPIPYPDDFESINYAWKESTGEWVSQPTSPGNWVWDNDADAYVNIA